MVRAGDQYFCLVEKEKGGATFSCPRNVNAPEQRQIPGACLLQRKTRYFLQRCANQKAELLGAEKEHQSIEKQKSTGARKLWVS